MFHLFPLFAGTALGAAIAVLLLPGKSPAPISTAPVVTTSTSQLSAAPKSLAELVALPANDLATIDIAQMNLLCAVGLPGAEELTSQRIDELTTELDRIAAKVRFETDRHLYRVTDPRYKDNWAGSEARFRADMLKQVL